MTGVFNDRTTPERNSTWIPNDGLEEVTPLTYFGNLYVEFQCVYDVKILFELLNLLKLDF